MKTVVRLSTALANKALGAVDAGACDARRGCCCNAAHTYGINCYSNCVKMSCSTRTSAYGQPCSL